MPGDGMSHVAQETAFQGAWLSNYATDDQGLLPIRQCTAERDRINTNCFAWPFSDLCHYRGKNIPFLKNADDVTDVSLRMEPHVSNAKTKAHGLFTSLRS